MTNNDLILQRRNGACLTITINRPEKANSLTREMLIALRDAFVQAKQDAELHAVIITGAGERVFCAGADLATLHDKVDGADPWEEFSWLSKKIAIDGSPVFRVAERITRCAATSVNPETAVRDINLPRLLASAFTHEDFGVYVSALNDTHIETGQTISIV